MKLPLYIILFLFGVAIAQTAYFYPLLPDIVASHFDATGRVNGTSTKLTYLILYFIALLITSGFALVLPLMLKYLPTSMINLPHREYWLSGEHREASLQFLNVHFSWFGVATTLVMVFIFHLTFLANISPSQNLSTPVFWGLIGTYLLYTIWWTVILLRRFQLRS